MRYSPSDSIQIIRFLRYRNQPTHSISKTYMSLRDIAKFLNRSISYVHYKCKEIKQPRESNPKYYTEIELSSCIVLKKER